MTAQHSVLNAPPPVAGQRYCSSAVRTHTTPPQQPGDPRGSRGGLAGVAGGRGGLGEQPVLWVAVLVPEAPLKHVQLGDQGKPDVQVHLQVLKPLLQPREGGAARETTNQPTATAQPISRRHLPDDTCMLTHKHTK